MVMHAWYNDDGQRQQYRKPYSIAVRRYLPMSGVIGVALGAQEQEDGSINWEGDLVLQVRVTNAEQFTNGEISDDIEGIEIQVLEGNGLEPLDQGMRWLSERTEPVEPLRPGVGIGIPGGAPGTLGMFVGEDYNYILTADHVIAPRGHGDDDRVYQPAPMDYAVNHRSQIGWVDRRLPANGVSLIHLDTDRRINNSPLDTDIQLEGTRPPEVGDILEKSGKATGITRAKVARCGVYQGCKPGFELVPVDGNPNTEISMGGDSGAVWYDPNTGEAIGVQCRGDGDLDYMTEWARAASLYPLAPYLGVAL